MDENFTRNNLLTVSEISVYQLVRALSDAAFICDHAGCIIACSDEVISFFGIADIKKVTGSTFQSFIAYDFIDEASYLFLQASESGTRKSGVFPVRKSLSDTINSTVTFTCIQSESTTGNYILVTFRDAPAVHPEIALLYKRDVRLSRLLGILSVKPGDPAKRINKLVFQVGETLGAVSCAYSKLENNELIPVASWESPFNKGMAPQLFSKQLFDYCSDHNETLSLVRKPLLTEFLKSEPSYHEDFGVKALLGIPILKKDKFDGILAIALPFNYSLPEPDRQFLQTISSIIANEESAEPGESAPAELSFRDLIDRFADPVFVLSPKGLIMEVNKGALRYFGYEREEMIGQTPLLLSKQGEENTEIIFQHIDTTLAGESQKFEWQVELNNGEPRTFETCFNKIKFNGHDAVIAISSDLTEVKKVINELKRQNDELTDSNLSKDKFFSIFAHDLKNPFQGLLGFIDLLYEDLDELSNQQVKEYLANVRSASYQTYALLENLLEWSRIQSGKMPFTPTVFDIHDEINSVISVLENNATQKEVRLVNEVNSSTMVEADRNMIHSVIQNLVTNSIKFSNANGRVVIRARVPLTYAKAKSTDEITGRHWLEVSVSDNGIGIPEEILPKLFKLNGQYSSTGTANEPGTGLGLVLCHEMVEKHGGRIWAESIPGQGTTFVFTVMLGK